MSSATAICLIEHGARVTLVADDFPGANEAESAILHLSQGLDRQRFQRAERSRASWRKISLRRGEPIYRETGVLVLGAADAEWERASFAMLRSEGQGVEAISELGSRFPAVSPTDLSFTYLEVHAGLVEARRAAQVLYEEALAMGAHRIESHAGEGMVLGAQLSQLGSQQLMRLPRADLRLNDLPPWIERGARAWGIPAYDGRPFLSSARDLDQLSRRFPAISMDARVPTVGTADFALIPSFAEDAAKEILGA